MSETGRSSLPKYLSSDQCLIYYNVFSFTRESLG